MPEIINEPCPYCKLLDNGQILGCCPFCGHCVRTCECGMFEDDTT